MREAYFPTFVLDMLFSGASSEWFPDVFAVREDLLLMLTCADEHGKRRKRIYAHIMGGDKIVSFHVSLLRQ